MNRKEERLHDATVALNDAHQRVGMAFSRANPRLVPEDAPERHAIVMEIRAAVEALREACLQWVIADAYLDTAEPDPPVGTLVLVHDDAGNVLTRTAAPAFRDDEGDFVVSLEGLDGHVETPALFMIDDVQAFIGEYSTGEAVAPAELGEEGCPGCVRIGGALCVLQEAHRRLAAKYRESFDEQWRKAFPAPARPPGPPLYGPGSPDDRGEEEAPDDPEAN